MLLPIADAADARLAERIRGQTVDLALEVIPQQGRPLGPTGAERIARALGAAARVDAVVWSRVHTDGGRTVYVAIMRPRSLLVRLIPASAGGGSATAEAAALVVRSALRALIAGAGVGAKTPAAPPPAAAPERAPISPPGGHYRWFGGLQWEGRLDGESASGRHAAAVSLGLQRGRLLVGLRMAIGFTTRLEDDVAAIDLTRHTWGVVAGVELVDRSWFRAHVLGVVSGAATFRTSTTNAANVRATPKAMLAALVVAPEAVVLLRPWSHPEGLWLTIAAAVEITVGAPELGYETDGRFETRYVLWRVQPRAAVGLLWRTE